MIWCTMIECLWNVYDMVHDDRISVEQAFYGYMFLKDHLILSKMEGFWGTAQQWVPQK